jgi:hypothetical protein
MYLLIISIICSDLNSRGYLLSGLGSISSKGMWNMRRGRRHENNGAWRTRDLAGKNAPELKTTHMDAYKSNKLPIVGIIKNHRAPRNANIASRRGCHTDAQNFFTLDLDVDSTCRQHTGRLTRANKNQIGVEHLQA